MATISAEDVQKAWATLQAHPQRSRQIADEIRRLESERSRLNDEVRDAADVLKRYGEQQ